MTPDAVPRMPLLPPELPGWIKVLLSVLAVLVLTACAVAGAALDWWLFP